MSQKITLHTPSEKKRLNGQLGTVGIVFMVVAAAAPLTVIGGNMPLAMGIGNGAGAPVGFIIASLVLLIFSVGFVQMTPYVDEAGAFFSYVRKGLGRRPSMGVAAVALVAYTAIQVGIYGYIGWAIDDTIRFYGGPSLPWPLYSLLVLIIVAFLGYRHIDLSAKVLGVALALEISIVVIINLIVVFTAGTEGLTAEPFNPAVFTEGSLGIAVLFSLTGFIGFEATAIFRDEARNPEKTIPRATYAAVLVIGLFYAITSWVFVVQHGADNVQATAQETLDGNANMLLDTAAVTLGSMGRDIMNVLLLTSLFACVLSFHNVIARYQFMLASRGTLPRMLNDVHPRHLSPHKSSLVQTITAIAILAIFAIFGVDPLVGVFGSMAGVATVGMMILLLSTSVAVITFFAKNPILRGRKFFRSLVAPTLASAGIVISLWLVLSNFMLVTGGSFAISLFLGLIPFVAFGIGAVFFKEDEHAHEVVPQPPVEEEVEPSV
ncbi:APC family permease [Enteractinococcus fodinae]|uniref:Amino acid transporter n=1 Tax=Enteractinococcus fodinae TaxID=684663 RepID=A0ABU2B507_9MICC|nr:APC family permease [Enteractinococcus fodinae]MDR7347868.1 amino acid transporter [Enteractinococcus fodinae]